MGSRQIVALAGYVRRRARQCFDVDPKIPTCRHHRHLPL
jgi:hypothetical protein